MRRKQSRYTIKNAEVKVPPQIEMDTRVRNDVRNKCREKSEIVRYDRTNVQCEIYLPVFKKRPPRKQGGSIGFWQEKFAKILIFSFSENCQFPLHRMELLHYNYILFHHKNSLYILSLLSAYHVLFYSLNN